MVKDNKSALTPSLQQQPVKSDISANLIDSKQLEKQPKSDLQTGSQVRFDPELNVNPFKAIASATIGFPIACAATAFIGIFVGLAKIIQLAGLHISKTLKDDKQDPMAAMPYEVLTGALKSMWTNFGVYSVIAGGKTAKFFFNQTVKGLDVEMQNFFTTELMKAEEDFDKGKITKTEVEKKMNDGINGGAAKTWNEALTNTSKEPLGKPLGNPPEELGKQMKEGTIETAKELEKALNTDKDLPKEQIKQTVDSTIKTGAALTNQIEKASGPGPTPGQGSGIPQKGKDGKWSKL